MIYAYASVTITNPTSLAAYREKADAALALHGGKIEVATADATAIDGVPAIPDAAGASDIVLLG